MGGGKHDAASARLLALLRREETPDTWPAVLGLALDTPAAAGSSPRPVSATGPGPCGPSGEQDLAPDVLRQLAEDRLI